MRLRVRFAAAARGGRRTDQVILYRRRPEMEDKPRP